MSLTTADVVSASAFALAASTGGNKGYPELVAPLHVFPDRLGQTGPMPHPPQLALGRGTRTPSVSVWRERALSHGQPVRPARVHLGRFWPFELNT